MVVNELMYGGLVCSVVLSYSSEMCQLSDLIKTQQSSPRSLTLRVDGVSSATFGYVFSTIIYNELATRPAIMNFVAQ